MLYSRPLQCAELMSLAQSTGHIRVHMLGKFSGMGASCTGSGWQGVNCLHSSWFGAVFWICG